MEILAALTPVLVLLLGGVGWLYRHERERRAAVERQLSEDKYNAYIELIDIFFDAFKHAKKGKSFDAQSSMERMIDANKELVMYGSDEVVKTYFDWLASARSGTIDMELFGDVVIAIRRDMGNSKTELTSHDFLRMLLSDFDRALEEGDLQQQIDSPQ